MFEPVDVICGGFPCQDVSFAGTGAGLAGTRSGLWREMVRAICLVGPQYAVVENVAALLSRGMGTVLGDLAEIGHDAEWDCLSACRFGAPHARERVFIVSYPHREGRLQPQGLLEDERQRIGDGSWWATEPNLERVAYGVPNGVDRDRCIGNAVIPQAGEYIGGRIIAAQH